MEGEKAPTEEVDVNLQTASLNSDSKFGRTYYGLVHLSSPVTFTYDHKERLEVGAARHVRPAKIF